MSSVVRRTVLRLLRISNAIQVRCASNDGSVRAVNTSVARTSELYPNILRMCSQSTNCNCKVQSASMLVGTSGLSGS